MEVGLRFEEKVVAIRVNSRDGDAVTVALQLAMIRRLIDLEGMW